jgi:2-polyprenyl-6-methoxyphenol hydroxylase-like FAD-dependent oxidoreductase
MQNKTQVLIIGAGPTGLMAACQLAMRKVSVRIIDQSAGPTSQSRALAIQARSMEIFEQMGIIGEFLAQGHPAIALNMVINGQPKARLDLGQIAGNQTKYPYVFMLEQSKTERILLKFLETLGVQVEWNTVLKSFTQSDEGVEATLQISKDDNQFAIEADYLIGADGAGSTVRQQLGLGYEGKTYHKDFFVLDCDLSNWNIANDEIYMCLSGNSFAAFFPMHPPEYRVIGVVPHFSKNQALNFNDVYPSFLRDMSIPATLSNPKWISEYHAHHRCVNAFRVGRCFVAGDAAHIHSPVGAQGMNTGLQDAVNLAWKLALVIQGRAQSGLLNSYHHERFQVANKLVHTTDEIFNFVVADNRFLHFLRSRIAPKVLAGLFNTKTFREKLFRIISETGISYADSIISKNGSGNFTQGSPKAGERLNYLPDIEKYLDHKKLQLLLFADDSGKTLAEQLNVHWGEIMDVHLIKPSTENEKCYQLFGVDYSSETQNPSVATVYIIRPDRHVAFRGKAGLIEIQKYLTEQMDLLPA